MNTSIGEGGHQVEDIELEVVVGLGARSSHLDDVRSWGRRKGAQRRAAERFQERFGGLRRSGGCGAFNTPPQGRGHGHGPLRGRLRE